MNTSNSRYEHAVFKLKAIDGGLKQSFLQTQKSLHLLSNRADLHQRTIWETAVTVIGPAFYFFTWWVLKRAREQSIRRLYFLSRDGGIFYKIAQFFNEKSADPLELRYLYGSRHLWLVAAIDKIGPEEIKWIFSDWWYELTVRSVCRRMGLTPELIKDFLSKCGFPESQWDQILSSPQIDRLKVCLREDTKLQSKIIDLLYPKFENTLGYLQQEGLDDGSHFALVDVGWRGKPQATLHKILRRGKISLPHGLRGLYFGITEGSEVFSGDSMESFLFDLPRSLTRFRLRNNHLYEAFCSSTEGKIRGFERTNGRFEPVLDVPSSRAVVAWGVKLQQEGILAFAREFSKVHHDHQISQSDVHEVLSSILSLFIERPSPIEAEVYGSFPMDGEMTEDRIKQIAPLTSRKNFWISCVKIKSFELFWVQASFIRSKLKFEAWLWRWLLPIMEFIFYFLIYVSGRSLRTLVDKEP